MVRWCIKMGISIISSTEFKIISLFRHSFFDKKIIMGNFVFTTDFIVFGF